MWKSVCYRNSAILSNEHSISDVKHLSSKLKKNSVAEPIILNLNEKRLNNLYWIHYCVKRVYVSELHFFLKKKHSGLLEFLALNQVTDTLGSTVKFGPLA